MAAGKILGERSRLIQYRDSSSGKYLHNTPCQPQIDTTMLAIQGYIVPNTHPCPIARHILPKHRQPMLKDLMAGFRRPQQLALGRSQQPSSLGTIVCLLNPSCTQHCLHPCCTTRTVIVPNKMSPPFRHRSFRTPASRSCSSPRSPISPGGMVTGPTTPVRARGP